MLPMLQKHALITAALMATLSVTACSKSKGSNVSKTNSQKQTASTDAHATDSSGGLSDLPDPSAGGDYDTPLPTDPVKPTPGKNTPPPPPPVTTAPSQPTQPALPPVVDTKPFPAPGPIGSDYRDHDAKNVTKDNFGKRLTGGVTSEGLLFTSSSTDTLVDFLRVRSPRSYDSQNVVSASLNTDGLSGDAILTLKIQEGGDVKVYNLAGSNGFDSGSAVQLNSVREANGQQSTGLRPVSASLKCMDLDGGCDTTYVKVKLGYQGAESCVNIVFRSSPADLYFSLPGDDKVSGNPEYLLLEEMALNTINQENSNNRIKVSRMNSWEVVNGRSGFSVLLKGRNNELLAFAGPLLAPQAGTGVNIALSRIAKDQEDQLNLISTNNSKLNYANSIGEARLIANNSLGQIRISLKMRKRGNYAQDQFAVTFMRRIKPVIDVTDDNLR